MHRRHLLQLILFGIATFALATGLGAREEAAPDHRGAPSRRSDRALKGLKRLLVRVDEGFGPRGAADVYEHNGLDTQSLETNAVAAIRRAGIEAFPASEHRSSKLPTFVISIDVEQSNINRDLYAFNVHLHLDELARPLRKTAVAICDATTWDEADATGMFYKQDTALIRQGIDEQLRNFLSDCRDSKRKD